MAVVTGDLVRVETEIGHFVVKAWVTEGIRPGVVACSHHMGRWRPAQQGEPKGTASASLHHEGTDWSLSRSPGVKPLASADGDTDRIWWTNVGVHQNLTFSVHPDPISGQHCWHQAVRVRKADRRDANGDIAVDTVRAREVYDRWISKTRDATAHSPNGTRRPFWLMRPLKPGKDAFRLPNLG